MYSVILQAFLRAYDYYDILSVVFAVTLTFFSALTLLMGDKKDIWPVKSFESAIPKRSSLGDLQEMCPNLDLSQEK